jgi:hypothetical protein
LIILANIRSILLLAFFIGGGGDITTRELKALPTDTQIQAIIMISAWTMAMTVLRGVRPR